MQDRPDLPRDVAAGRFHLDHIRAHVAQRLGGIGPHQNGRDIDDADAVQRTCHAAFPSNSLSRVH